MHFTYSLRQTTYFMIWGTKARHISEATWALRHIKSPPNCYYMFTSMTMLKQRYVKIPHYWSFVRGIDWWPLDSPHKGPVIREPLHWCLLFPSLSKIFQLFFCPLIPDTHLYCNMNVCRASAMRFRNAQLVASGKQLLIMGLQLEFSGVPKRTRHTIVRFSTTIKGHHMMTSSNGTDFRCY